VEQIKAALQKTGFEAQLFYKRKKTSGYSQTRRERHTPQHFYWRK
jgi:hypothetical protein